MEVPSSLRAEHRELLSTLEKAAKEEGAVGDAARVVAEKLRPHFNKEEEFALSPLGALTLSGEERTADPQKLIELTGRLREELPIMLEEHVQIAIALEALKEEAGKAGREEYVRFSESLLHHALMEEEVLYPAALLIGSYVRQSIRQKA